MGLFEEAQKSERRFEEKLHDAFGFLVDDFNYKSEPLERSRGGFEVFRKRYTLGSRCISYSGNYDREPFFQLQFFPIDVFARMERHPGVIFRDSCNWTLERAMSAKGLAPDLVKKPSEPQHPAEYFGQLLREHCIDLIKGDFHIFPEVYFEVEHKIFSATSEVLGRFCHLEDAVSCALERVSKGGHPKMEETTVFIRTMAV